MKKPIPAFYACYLLRSTVRHASLYVGSTPNPARRLKQHNGDAPGGAVRTSRDSLRPWEMTCLVTGFPSRIAALQFEWAWQNPHHTRHLSPNTRLTKALQTTRFSPKTGRVRKRAARPRLSLTDRLANLHVLLRASSFARWPLKVTFYAQDVFRVWQKWTNHEPVKLRPGIEVLLDSSAPFTTTGENAPSTAIGIQALDVGYSSLKSQVEKAQTLLATPINCVGCDSNLPNDSAMTVLCPNPSCNSAGHLGCFASAFLKHDPENLVPTSGSCPGCETELQWVDLVKELSLRIRDEKEVERIFKPPRTRGKKQQICGAALTDLVDDATADDEEMEELIPHEDEWHQLSDSSDVPIDEYGVASDPTALRQTTSGYTFAFHSEPVIEESDWDDAELIT